MVETITFVGMYVGESNHSRLSEGWCEMDVATIHSEVVLMQNGGIIYFGSGTEGRLPYRRLRRKPPQVKAVKGLRKTRVHEICFSSD